MERKEYLELCQKVSEYQNINEIPPELRVKWGEIDFYPSGYKLSFTNGKPRHTAILRSLSANRVINCELEKVGR